MLTNTHIPVRIFIVVSLIVLFLWVMLYIKNSYHQNHSPNATLDSIVLTLYRQCARWAVASKQDDSEIIRVLHANYATGYLWAIKDIVSTNEFKKITGEDFLEFEKHIVNIQDKATERLVIKCKSVIPIQDPLLLKAMYKSPSPSPST
jgi:hypothetical protein